MVRLAEGFIGVDLWYFFAGGEHLFETEQVTVDTLTVGSPGGVLHMSSDSPLEQRSAVGILLKECEDEMLFHVVGDAHGLARV